MKKILSILLLSLALTSFAQQKGELVVDTNSKSVISRHIYGHFSEHLGRCIYDGFWVDEKMGVPKKDRIRLDIVEALKKIGIPNLRWPGGCFADEYHWRDGIGPRAQRPKMVNTNWGGVTEDNSFGTHEFLELCELLKCEPYIAGNVGSGTVEEMAKWVEYLNADGESSMAKLRKENGHAEPWKVSFWGVGNESWGCGGNMTPEFYADQYRRYATYARNYRNAPLKKIASGANSEDYNWTEVCMKKIPVNEMWGISMHYYTLPTGNWAGKKGSATQFDEKEYFNTMKNCLKIEELVTKHSAIMDKYDPKKKVGLVVDEWGIWTDVEPGTNPGFLYQQNSLRDALVAGSSLNIFNNHSDRVKMAELAQTVNVLQALVLTEKDKMLLTPTYYIFQMYLGHHDAKLLPVKISAPDYVSGDQKIPSVNVSASLDSLGRIHVTLVNLDPTKSISINTAFNNMQFKTVTGQVLTSPNLTDCNTFALPNKIHIEKFTGFQQKGNQLTIDMPAKAVVSLELK